MSKDLTPRQLYALQQHYNMPNIVFTIKIVVGDKEEDLYIEDQKDLARQYPRLGICGFDFLLQCKNNGILSSKLGRQYIQDVEDVISGNSINYKEFEEAILKWYDGRLEPGYYMTNNNTALVEFITNMLVHVDPDIDID